MTQNDKPIPAGIAPAPLLPFLSEVEKGRGEVCLSGLRGGASLLAVAYSILRTDGPAVVICRDSVSARGAMRDLAFLLGGEDSEQARRLRLFPALDVSPFESISPHRVITGQRLSSLASLLAPNANTVLVAPVEALMERVVPRDLFAGRTLEVISGDLMDRDEFAAELVAAGYTSAPLTEDFGDFSLRGGIVDLFCPAYDRPIRIELFDIEITSVRFFDAATQVSRNHVDRVRLCPARQIVLDQESRDRFLIGIKNLTDELGLPKNRRDALVEQISSGVYFPGIEFFLPLFYEKLQSVLDYLPTEAPQFLLEPAAIESAADNFEEKVIKRHKRAEEAGKVVCPIDSLYLSAKEVAGQFDSRRQIRVGLDAYPATPNAEVIHLPVEDHSELRSEIIASTGEKTPLAPLIDRIEETRENGGHFVLVFSSHEAADRMERMLSGSPHPASVEKSSTFREIIASPADTPKIPILIGGLRQGFRLPDTWTTVVTEEEIFGQKRRSESSAKFRGEAIASFGDLMEDDYVVHLLHGVGIYRKLEQLWVGGVKGEFLLIEYAKGDKLYLPVYRLSQVHRYVGGGQTPIVDRLGSQTWEKAKKKARASARAIAKELLQLYAARRAKQGFGFMEPDNNFSEFEETFPYEETPDQLSSIKEVIADMVATRPMDRLVCGDVGFGKTEVAIRSAYLAVQSGKQVAVLVPTTTLAFQHYRTFRNRLEPFGVNVIMLSRFTPPKALREGLADLEKGTVDIAVGTHKLLGKQVKYKDLGLLVVDEEQHFGVVQKEKIKKLKEEVDVLSMTATPIPRTLNMALSGLRDLSVINTPPEDRLAVRTYITPWDNDTLSEAINRELQRGGQVFVVHNRIKSLPGIADRVRQLAPGARIRIAHGQQEAKVIEKVLIDFAEHNFDILVSTAIVESGLDFPRANTIIIHRADILGLSQLYQLRGRVGRSKLRAYCYLVTPSDKVITNDARKRLAVLRTFTDLGSGYKIAARDMEIRGAGNLLGAEQSGHVVEVGFELFTELLEEEVHRLKGEPVEEKIDTEVSLPVPAFLPEDYVEDVGQRLSIYKKFSDAENLDDVHQAFVEVQDRYGPPPIQVKNLVEIMELKVRARSMWVTSIEAGPETVGFVFDNRTSVQPEDLVKLATENPDRYSISPDGKFAIRTGKIAPAALLEIVKKTLQHLG